MHRPNWLSALAVGLAFAGCTATESDPATDTAAVRQELTDRMAALEEALLAGDTEEVLGFWTSDAQALEPGLNLSGDQLHEFFRNFLSTDRVVSFDIEVYDQFVHGDVAYEVGEYDETVEVAGQQQTVRNHYFLRWERGIDGAWRIDRFLAGPREAPSAM